MTYREDGPRITLEMSIEEWEELVIMTGFAAGASRDRDMFWRWIDFANRLNATNARFKPYELPKEYKGK
jgi:hypothetical protein